MSTINAMRLFLFCLLLFAGRAYGQETIINCTDSGYCIPSIDGMPRSKGLVIRQERVENYNMQTMATTGSRESGNARVDKNRRWTAQLKLPLLNRDNFKLAVGLRYSVEEYRFFDPQELDY